LAGGTGKSKVSEVGRRVKKKATEQAKDVAGKGSTSQEDADAPEAHGSGRRMPVEQESDVAVPLKDTYNLWTEFEEWPSFMHRVDSVRQIDDTTLSFSVKVWGITKEFEAEIVEQKPDELIK